MIANKAPKDFCGSAWQWIRDRKVSRRLRHSRLMIWLRSRPALNPKCVVAIFAPVAIVAGIFGYLLLPTPNVRIVLHASTEMVSFQVVNPDLAAFRVAGMRASAEDSDSGDCVTGVVLPAIGVTVEYTLTSSGKPAIRLSPPSKQTPQQRVAQFIDEADQTRPLDGSHRILSDETCKGISPQRFPILGSAEFGREYSTPTATLDPMRGALTDARLTFYAKSPRWFLFRYPSVYEWKRLDVPGGSRVGAIMDADNGSGSAWRGLAQFELDKDKDKAVYIVDASITARGIHLTIPGIGDQDSQIVFDKLSPLTSDPNWIALQLYAGIGIWVMVKLFEFWNWLGKRRALKKAKD